MPYWDRRNPPSCHFLTLEDEFGFINVIVRPKVYVQFRRIIRSEVLLLVSGEVQHEGGVTNGLVRHVEGLGRL